MCPSKIKIAAETLNSNSNLSRQPTSTMRSKVSSNNMTMKSLWMTGCTKSLSGKMLNRYTLRRHKARSPLEIIGNNPMWSSLMGWFQIFTLRASRLRLGSGERWNSWAEFPKSRAVWNHKLAYRGDPRWQYSQMTFSSKMMARTNTKQPIYNHISLEYLESTTVKLLGQLIQICDLIQMYTVVNSDKETHWQEEDIWILSKKTGWALSISRIVLDRPTSFPHCHLKLSLTKTTPKDVNLLRGG